MAANASLVMADARLFLKEDFPEYSCTGFRGQVNKPFNLDGAFIHIFKQSAPLDTNDLTMSCEHHLQKTFSKDACFRSGILHVLRMALNLPVDITWPETATTNPVLLLSEGPVSVHLSIEHQLEESIHPKSYPLRRVLLIAPTPTDSSRSMRPVMNAVEQNLHSDEYSCSASQVTVHLDLVVMRLHHVPTASSLYCYSSLLPDKDTFRPLCMHPPSWTHDLSFWHDDAFDEKQFLLLVRQVTNPYVTYALLVDEYADEATGRRARCYRMLYQSYVDALSWDRSIAVQEQLRLALTDRWRSCVIR